MSTIYIKVLNKLVQILSIQYCTAVLCITGHMMLKSCIFYISSSGILRSVRNVNNYSKHDLATHTYLDLCFIYEHCYLKATASSTVAIWYACTKVVSNSHDTSYNIIINPASFLHL